MSEKVNITGKCNVTDKCNITLSCNPVFVNSSSKTSLKFQKNMPLKPAH
ncbi:MAG: hypothetical protein IJ254_10210 [Succinivibrio sp.]|nr:hypothetical protein [Succinivibrio sp.]